MQNAQTELDLSHLPPARREGVRNAEERANREIDSWSELALEFLKGFARNHATVFGEDVTRAADAWGMVAPSNARAWGSVYIRAQNMKIIEARGETRKRVNGNLAPVYTSLLYKAKA